MCEKVVCEFSKSPPVKVVHSSELLLTSRKRKEIEECRYVETLEGDGGEKRRLRKMCRRTC